MPQYLIVAKGAVNMNLSNLCPMQLPWAPYYLMDSKIPHQALEMCLELFAKMINVADITRATPMSDWLRAPCVRLGHNAMDRRLSLLNQGFEPMVAGARVIRWMQGKVAWYQKATLPNIFSTRCGYCDRSRSPPRWSPSLSCG